MTEPASGEPEYGVAPEGHRLPAGTGLGPVHLQVSDLSRSVRYYGRVLGLEPRTSGVGTAALGVPGASDVLVRLHERKDAAGLTGRALLGLYHFAVLLPGRAALGRFVEHLQRVGEPAGASDHLVSEAIYLRDPDGLGVEVYADRPRESWRHDGGQLVMATRPLDLESMIRAGEGESWKGSPPGTRIGHVHLHVGDLSRAEAFYHRGLGLDKTVWSYPGALFLSAGGYHHHLGLNTWARGAEPAGAGDARLLDWELRVPDGDDVRAVAESLEGAGYEVQRESEQAVVTDPWGIRLRIVENPGQGGSEG